MDKTLSLEEIIVRLANKYEEQIENVEETLQAAISIKPDVLLPIMKELKNEYGLDFLTDLSAVDLGEEGLKGIYHVMSWKPYRVLRIEVPIPHDEAQLPSLVELWASADVQEREAYDMFGITYEGHPNLTRILLSDNFDGYPLLKSFKPVSRR